MLTKSDEIHAKFKLPVRCQLRVLDTEDNERRK